MPQTVRAAQEAAAPDTFADSVVSSSDLSINPLYDDPTATVGQPVTLINGIYDVPKGTYHDSMVYPAYNKSPKGIKLLVVLGSDGNGQVTVKFDTAIVHDPRHWYGNDLIVYGNPFFVAHGTAVTPTVDMHQVVIDNGSIYQNGVPTVSVSADGFNFVELEPSGTFWPTNPYLWGGNSSRYPSGWIGLADFTKPLNPALTPSSFSGLSVVDAVKLYAGSAGGEAFSLEGTEFETSGIQYVRFSGVGNIDAVARVSDNPAPLAPDSLMGRGRQDGVHLKWSASEGATTYDIYRGTSGGEEAATPLLTGATGVIFTDTTATASLTYYYVVTALNHFGESTSTSPEVCVHTAATPLSEPSGVSARDQNGAAEPF